ncbi:hypothetical protein ABGN05_13175 [Aquibium sp. LZ166]|uniref:Uncharacterized protein n=1 Tax=Aquibium pacificus TaxID=3153579 RepID=A0ABV3SIP4_9HYPH
MAKYDYGFEERRPSITRYVVWALAVSLAVGGFLYADGYFEKIVEQTTEAPNVPTGAG